MSDTKRCWTAAQQYAINCRERELLLSAGAGSGKTATLTERVCRLVTDKEHGVDVSRLLIVTFTRAAAEELRQRVRARLESELEADPSCTRLARQIVALEGADISTISGFFLKSIRPYFASLGLPPNFAVADEVEIKVMKDRIMSDTVDDFFDEGSDAFTMLCDAVSSAKSESSVNDAILAIANRLSAKGFTSEKLTDWAESLETSAGGDFLKSPHGAIILDMTMSFAKHHLALFEELRKRMSAEPEVAEKYGESADEHIRFLKELVAAAERESYGEVREIARSFAPSKLKTLKATEKTAASERFKAAKNEFKKRLEKDVLAYFAYEEKDISAVQKRTAQVLRELSRVIEDFSARFAAEKKERGVVDYEDIELFARKIFVAPDGSPTDAAYETAKKYDYIFIDEYQDTNSIQDSVFSAIASFIPRFMVGDVKQSIYAFRGAEPSVFTSYRDRMSAVDPSAPSDGGEHTLFMSENFRSDSSVIDFANLVSGFMFPGTSTPFEEGDRLICSKERPEGYTEYPVEVALIEKAKDDEDGDEEEAAPRQEVDLEAEYIAEKVAELLTSGRRADGSPVKEGDVAILVRSSVGADSIEASLVKRGIRVNDRAVTEFFEQKEILLVLCILNAIDNPLRDIYLTGALKSPVFGFTMDDLLKIRLGNTDTPLWYCVEKYATEGDERGLAEKCAHALSFFNSFRKRAESSDSAAVLRSLYDELNLYSLTDGASPDGAHASAVRENLTSLYEMARKFESTSFGGLYGFITYLEEMMERSKGGGAEAADDCVSIMTIHKSKGLEFPVCFVARCAKRFNMKDLNDGILFDPVLGPAMKLRDATGLVKCDNPLRAAVAGKMRYEAVCEEMRTLYVAMTRAKERLFVTVSVKDADGEEAEAAERAALRSKYRIMRTSSFADVILPASSHTDPSFVITKVTKDDIGTTVVEGGKKESEKAADSSFTEVLDERLSFVYPLSHLENIPAKVTVSKLTPSLLDDEEITETPFGGKEARAKRREAPVFSPGREKEVTGAERGTATHMFLQFCDFEKLCSNGFDSELERLTGARFLTKKTASLVSKKEIEAFVSSPLFDDIRKAVRVFREFRFNVSLPAASFTKNEELAEKLTKSDTAVTVQGVVDIVFESPDGTLTLADYKTDRLNDFEAAHPCVAKKNLSDRHRIQLTYYREACERIFERPIDRLCIYSLALGDTADIV